MIYCFRFLIDDLLFQATEAVRQLRADVLFRKVGGLPCKVAATAGSAERVLHSIEQGMVNSEARQQGTKGIYYIIICKASSSCCPLLPPYYPFPGGNSPY